MMWQPSTIVHLLTSLGPQAVLYRALYLLRRQSGMLRLRLPMSQWTDHSLASLLSDRSLAQPDSYFHSRRPGPAFFFSADHLPESRAQLCAWDADGAACGSSRSDLTQGTMRYFEHVPVHTGYPPRWHQNPLTGQRIAGRRHWSEIAHYPFGDIKLIWEASRFSFAFALVRDYGRTGDSAAAEVFWTLLEDWRKHNPPQCGPNWMCGQETALRILAWCFALYGFQSSPSTTPVRIAQLAQMIGVSAQRIEATLGYALSQQNNHGISEATALWTVGCLFPEFNRATRWANLGRRLLERQIFDLVYDDGAFSQHSLNYQRVMLDCCLWSMRLGELHGRPFSQQMYQRIEKASRFLHQMLDETTGRAPNYGHNDGALVLPLCNSDARDYRPVVQATHYLTTRHRCFTSGPWDERLYWLFGPEAVAATHRAAPATDLAAASGGYYTIRSETGFVMTRAPRFRHRPAQADALHVDLWWRGQNIALDAGTFSYNAAHPWDGGLAATRFHNCVTVDGRDQMERVGRFIWMPWLRGRSRIAARSPARLFRRSTPQLQGSAVHSARKSLAYWEGQHDGYRRLHDPVDHRRGILRLGNDHWLVVDRLSGAVQHDYCLHWLLADCLHQWDEPCRRLTLATAAGPFNVQLLTRSPNSQVTIVRADPASPRGWQSQYYQDREPAISLALETSAPAAEFWTMFGPEATELELLQNTIQVRTSRWEAVIRLSPPAGDLLLQSVVAEGELHDELSLS